MSSHPVTFLRSVERTLLERCALTQGACLAVAVSGGPDSMALLHALHLLRAKLKCSLLALSVDHGLRAEAAHELNLVRSFCAAQGIEFRGLELGLSASSNQQERAREARYAALWAAAREVFGERALLATAHHKQDRAETVLLRLLRGTSLAGLGVLPARSGALLRPAIAADKSAVLAHVARHDVPFCTDPSNADSRYLRVRVRRDVLPLLTELSPQIVDALAELADEASQGDAALGLNREQRHRLRQALRDTSSPVDLRLPAGLRLVRAASGELGPGPVHVGRTAKKPL